MRIISQVRHAKEQSLLLQSRQQQQQHKTLFPLKKNKDLVMKAVFYYTNITTGLGSLCTRGFSFTILHHEVLSQLRFASCDLAKVRFEFILQSFRLL